MAFFRRHPLLLVTAIIPLAVVVLLSATALAVWRAAHNDEARLHDHADLIAVLGAAQYNGTPSPTFEGRLRQGALLYQEGFASRVLVLGGNQPGDRTTEAEAGREWLIASGLPDSDVFAEPVGNSTLESLEAAATFMHERGLVSVFLVSDPWHNLRIRRMARDLGLEAYVSATFQSAARSQWTRLTGYSRETVAYIYYRIFGR